MSLAEETHTRTQEREFDNMVVDIDQIVLVEQYAPLMVLYPEIPQSSVRTRNENYPHESPLIYDYHPRDIRIVLEHAGFYSRLGPWKDKTHGWDRMLDRMEKAHYEKDLDLVPDLKVDDRAGFWNAYAAIPKDEDEFQRACYARVVWGKGIHHDRVIAQYWYPYFYNDFWNTHEMDWEVIMIVFKIVEGPSRRSLAQVGERGKGRRWQSVIPARHTSSSVRGERLPRELLLRFKFLRNGSANRQDGSQSSQEAQTTHRLHHLP